MAATWTAYETMTGIEKEEGALSVVRTPAGTSIVRKTTSGEFAVIRLDGRYAKIIKVLPTLDRARAYNRALA